MPRGTCLIFNWDGSGNSYDIKTTWGVSLSDGAISTLLAPPALKERVSNESRLENGKRIDTTADTFYQSRELTLEMHLIAPDFDTLVANERAFFAALNANPQGIILAFTIYGQPIRYRLQFLSCTQFAVYNGTLAKFAVRFIERNPQNGQVTFNMTNPNNEGEEEEQ